MQEKDPDISDANPALTNKNKPEQIEGETLSTSPIPASGQLDSQFSKKEFYFVLKTAGKKDYKPFHVAKDKYLMNIGPLGLYFTNLAEFLLENQEGLSNSGFIEQNDSYFQKDCESLAAAGNAVIALSPMIESRIGELRNILVFGGALPVFTGYPKSINENDKGWGIAEKVFVVDGVDWDGIQKYLEGALDVLDKRYLKSINLWHPYNHQSLTSRPRESIESLYAEFKDAIEDFSDRLFQVTTLIENIEEYSLMVNPFPSVASERRRFPAE